MTKRLRLGDAAWRCLLRRSPPREEPGGDRALETGLRTGAALMAHPPTNFPQVDRHAANGDVKLTKKMFPAERQLGKIAVLGLSLEPAAIMFPFRAAAMC